MAVNPSLSMAFRILLERALVKLQDAHPTALKGFCPDTCAQLEVMCGNRIMTVLAQPTAAADRPAEQDTMPAYFQRNP